MNGDPQNPDGDSSVPAQIHNDDNSDQTLRELDPVPAVGREAEEEPITVNGASGDEEDELDIDQVPDSNVGADGGTVHTQDDSYLRTPMSSPSSGSRLHSPSVSVSDAGGASQIRLIDGRFHTRLGSILAGSSPQRLRHHHKDPSAALDELAMGGTQTTPWGAVRWTKLRKLSGQLYSDATAAQFGHPTVTLPASVIVVGMSRGYVLAFDFHQNLKYTFGSSRSREWGEVTALAISADQTNVGVGYESGHIAVWDIARPAAPRIHVPPISPEIAGRSETDGHLVGSPVVHLSFVSRRRSAFYSADLRGMVFMHDSTRALLGRKVSTHRILGKYRTENVSAEPVGKASTILACSPQPIGADSTRLGLVAIMTPYLLAIVSTFPRPRTHFKMPRSRKADFAMGMSGCLAWFPSLKGRHGGNVTHINSRLVYCWSNVMEIAEFAPTSSSNGDEGVEIASKKLLVYEEPFVAVFWFSRHLIGAVTVTQRLVIISEETMTVTAQEDLLSKHMVHHDYFTRYLRGFVLRDHAGQDEGQPVVVTDAHFNSVRSFKGRMFLMGKYEFVLGSLSNWADRLLDIMEDGDYVHAIKLAASYYVGDVNLSAAGLPSDNDERHELIMKSLPDLMKASLSYEKKSSNEQEVSSELTEACFSALAVTGFDQGILNDMFEFYETRHAHQVFFTELVEFIYDGQIRSLSPEIFKELVMYYAKDSTVLEDLICRLDPTTLDLDLSYSLFKRHHLVDAQTFVTNQLFGDYVGPLEDYLELIRRGEVLEGQVKSLYAYLSFVLTGRVYPTGMPMADEAHAFKAKCSIYYFLFAGDFDADEASSTDDRISQYPRLSLLINTDPSAFYSALNEAFEDSFLNEGQVPASLGNARSHKEAIFGSTVNRQFIVNLLLDFFSDDPNSKIFLDIFLARNYPKYPQFIMLPGHVLERVLDELCHCPDERLKEECELAIRSLMSQYKVPDMEKLISTLYEVHYYSILEDIFRASQRLSKLLEAAILDFEAFPGALTENRLLAVTEECLNKAAKKDVPSKEAEAVRRLVDDNFGTLVRIDTERFAQVSILAGPDVYDEILKENDSELVYNYLLHVFKHIEQSKNASSSVFPSFDVRHAYISMLAKRGEAQKLDALISNVLVRPEDIKLASIVDDLIGSGRIDTLSKLLQRNLRHSEALIYMIDHIMALSDDYWTQDSAKGGVASELDRYVGLCIDLCNEIEGKSTAEIISGEPRKPSEALWIRLIEALVDISHGGLMNNKSTTPESRQKLEHVRSLLRKTLASLLNYPGKGVSAIQHNAEVVRIFRSILKPMDPSQTQSLGSVRPIIQDLYAAYKYQDTLLSVAAKLLDESAYASLMGLVGERLRGWRVSKSGECEGCGRKVVGVGIDATWLYEQWEEKERKSLLESHRAVDTLSAAKRAPAEVEQYDESVLVVFKCGHTYHLGCLRRLGGRGRIACIVCD